MRKVFVFGSSGFIGSNVLEVLKHHFAISETSECDVLINCAGFSRMYEGNKNPTKMEEVEDSVFKRIDAFSFKHIIHLSTIYIDVYPQDVYSIIKKTLEDCILSKYRDVMILRLGGVIGKGLKKNVVFDIAEDKQLFVTADSIYNYISAHEIAEIIVYLIDNPMRGIINIGSSESITAKEIASIFGKNPVYGQKKEVICIDTSVLQHFYKTKSSKEYIGEFCNQMKKVKGKR